MSPALREWLAGNATELASLEPGAPPEDLGAFDAAVRGAGVVGLGQAVRGSRESITLVHRLIERLVAVHGVRTVAIAASESATRLLDDHVRGRDGDAGELLENLGTWPWRTLETVALVDWLRERNRGEPPFDQVRLAGIEPVRAATAVRAVAGFLRTAAPDTLDGRGELLGALLADRVTPRIADPVQRTLAEIVAVLGDHPGALAADPEDRAEAREHAHYLARTAELAGATDDDADATRSRLLADAVLELAEGVAHPGPVAVWAPADDVGVREQEGPSLGAQLRCRLGVDYYATTLTCGDGVAAVRRRRALRGWTPDAQRVRLSALPPGAVESTLAEQGGDLFVDLRGLPGPVADEWAGRELVRRSVGEGVVGSRTSTTPWGLLRESDGLLYVHRTRPARAD